MPTIPSQISVLPRRRRDIPYRRQDFRAVILAAGRGSRLEGATASKPKCLIEIGGKPLIQHQIDMLRQCEVDDVLVVAGYRAEDVEAATAHQTEVIRSEIWNRTNSLYSLSLCKRHIAGNMVVMNCDVLAHPAVLRRVLERKRLPKNILIGSSVQRRAFGFAEG